MIDVFMRNLCPKVSRHGTWQNTQSRINSSGFTLKGQTMENHVVAMCSRIRGSASPIAIKIPAVIRPRARCNLHQLPVDDCFSLFMMNLFEIDETASGEMRKLKSNLSN